jgi:hypothetical protein
MHGFEGSPLIQEGNFEKQFIGSCPDTLINLTAYHIFDSPALPTAHPERAYGVSSGQYDG